MNKRQTEYIALYLFVFGAILLFGVLTRKFVLVKGYDEFSAAVAFFATVVVLSALYISLQMTLNELLLPRMVSISVLSCSINIILNRKCITVSVFL